MQDWPVSKARQSLKLYVNGTSEFRIQLGVEGWWDTELVGDKENSDNGRPVLGAVGGFKVVIQQTCTGYL